MRKRQSWLAALLASMLIMGGFSSVYGQTPIEPGVAMDLPVTEGVNVTEPAPAMDLPVRAGQDYVEPGVTPEMSRERAITLARQALLTHMEMDVTDGSFQMNTEYRRDWQLPERYVWSIYWYLNEPMAYANASVTIDASSGEILDMNHDQGKYGDDQGPQLTLTREDAAGIAEAFVNKLVPGRLDEMKARNQEDLYPAGYPMGSYQYTFNYVRDLDGIVYDANFVNISVDGSSGKIKWYSQRWESDPDLPDTEGVISREEASGLFADLARPELFFLPMRNEFMYEPIPKNFRLAYRLDPMLTMMINAKTGHPVDWSGQDGGMEIRERDVSASQKSAIARLAEPVVPLEEPMDQQQAQEWTQRYARQLLGKPVQIQSLNYLEGDQYWESAGRKVWNMDFVVTEETAGTSERTEMMAAVNGRVMINALTGELIAFNFWQYHDRPYDDYDDPVMTWEEGYDRAIEIISEYQPGRIDQIRTHQRTMIGREVMDGQMVQPTEYYFQFPRLIEGILMEENHIAVGINAVTGQITNYTDRWSESLTLPRGDQVMSAARAQQSMLNNFELELAYFRFTPQYDMMNPQHETKLIYRLVPGDVNANYPYIDAITGTRLDYNGRGMPARDSSGFEARISGHWVERTARLMAQQGILDTTLFSPDESVTRMEAVKMMVRARGTDYYGPMMDMGGEKVEWIDVPETDEDYRYIEWAVRYGYIDNLPEAFEREALIPREEMAEMLVRFMGYQALAAADEIFRVDYLDSNSIAKEALGSVAISRGLGIISSGGYFRPNDNTTMAELAEMLFKAVAHQRR